MKKLLAINDISCVGKCSLTVSLPIISALNVETSVVPTAILSTHTGGFTGYTFRDLTSDFLPILKHFQELSLEFDALYAGYLGSQSQISLVKEYFRHFAKSLKILDPVMADNGRLYTNFSDEYPQQLLELVSEADVLIPNLTEAALLLDVPYKEKLSETEVKKMLIRLANLGPKIVILTGISFADDLLGAYAYNKEENKFYSYFTKKVPGYYHGTGDIFASVVAGVLTSDGDIAMALKKAVLFTADAIKDTYLSKRDPKYGVLFESYLPCLRGKDYETRDENY